MNVSIITPVYNEPRVKRALKSVFDQAGAHCIETIVVDGGSTDETIGILEGYRDRIDILVQEDDEGVYDAMNKGIEKASGDVVGILNADDYYQDRYVIRDILERMEETGADTCYGNLVYVDSSDNPVRYWNSLPYRPYRFYFGWMPPHPTFFIRSRIYEKFGYYDTDYSIAADYELMLRFLLAHKISTTYIDRILVRMATGGQSNESVRNIVRANREVLYAWRKNDLRGGVLAPFLKPLRKLPQFMLWRFQPKPNR